MRLDVTYFYSTNSRSLNKANKQFQTYVQRQVRELKELRQLLADKTGELNHRQLALLNDALRNAGREYTLAGHAQIHGVTHETARSDLHGLTRRGLLARHAGQLPHRFTPVPDLAARRNWRSPSRTSRLPQQASSRHQGAGASNGPRTFRREWETLRGNSHPPLSLGAASSPRAADGSRTFTALSPQLDSRRARASASDRVSAAGVQGVATKPWTGSAGADVSGRELGDLAPGARGALMSPSQLLALVPPGSGRPRISRPTPRC